MSLQDFKDAVRSAGLKIEHAWDWPIVPENKYSASDRDRYKSLRSCFTAVASTTGAATCIALQTYSPAVIIPVAIAAIAGAHYIAGATSEYLRSRNRSGPDPE